jgi:uncharacterized protein YifN (PemK superfamily)
MAINYHPSLGTVLVCDYHGFKEPEMVKRRPAVVVSPRLRRRDGLCTVVPLSTTPPNPPMNYHCKIAFDPRLPSPYDAPEHWVKADMLATVGFHRLFLLSAGRDQYGKRRNVIPVLDADRMKEIRVCILMALGIDISAMA